MANQIGKFFSAQDRTSAPAKIADHVKKFWDPRMRAAILEYVDAGGGGLDPDARLAIEKLRSRAGGV